MPKACTQQSTHSANMVSEDQEKVLQKQTARQYCTRVRGTVLWPWPLTYANDPKQS